MTTAAAPEIGAEQALQIINHAQTGGMYPKSKAVPDDDGERIKEAGDIVGLSKQAATIAARAPRENVPSWPIHEQILTLAGFDPEQLLEQIRNGGTAPAAAPPAPAPEAQPQPAQAPPAAPVAAPALAAPPQLAGPVSAPTAPAPTVADDEDLTGELEADPADAAAWKSPPGVGVGDGDETVEVPPTHTPGGLAAEAAKGASDPFAAAGLTRASDMPDQTPALPEIPNPEQRPQVGEVWSGTDGQVMMILAAGDGPVMEVRLKGMPEDSKTEVPVGFATHRLAEAAQPGEHDYTGPPAQPPIGSGNPVEHQVQYQQPPVQAPVPQQPPAPVQHTINGQPVDPSQIAPNTMTLSDQQAAQMQQSAVAPPVGASADPFTAALGAPAPQHEQPAPPPAPQQQPPGWGAAPQQQAAQSDPWAAQPQQASHQAATPPAQGFQPVQQTPRQPEPVQAPPVPAAVAPTTPTMPPVPGDGAGAINRPLHNTDGDKNYQKILDDVDRRRTPTGVPIPQDIDGQPMLLPPNLVEVDDEQARRYHSYYNALAARMRYLHDLEDDYARGCDLPYKQHLKAAMREARAKLGKSASVTEVEHLAEDDEVVSLWKSRRDTHRSEAAAFKTLFEIFSENVRVLSRDWTMRDKEQRGA